MTQLPQRVSLVAQVSDIIRTRLQTGEWSARLPSERYLSDHLQVSRSTLRSALHALREEGLIEIQGKRHRLAQPLPTRAFRPSDSKIIRFITPDLLHSLAPFKLYQVDELRRHLHDSGFTLEFHSDKRFRCADVTNLLKSLVMHSQAACWILNVCSAEVQRWFSKQRMPAIVAGSRQTGVDLPGLDFDYRAVSLHAAGLFLRMGHRSVALVIPKSGALGDLVSEQGFLEGFQKSRQTDALPLIAGHDGTVKGICQALDSLLRLKRRPTALFVAYSQPVLTVMSYLSHLSLRVPHNISLVARQSDPIFEHLVPSIATYTFSVSQYALRLSQMTARLIHTGSLRSRQFLVPGEFRRGDSLARCTC
jgi:DNA-binding LacI/PurR family transcriptional regulator